MSREVRHVLARGNAGLGFVLAKAVPALRRPGPAHFARSVCSRSYRERGRSDQSGQRMLRVVRGSSRARRDAAAQLKP
jgi:hypothetical protein